MLDPRHKNVIFSGSVQERLHAYASTLQKGLSEVSPENLEKAIAAVESAAMNRRFIYTIGNGGSAAIAEHLCCDWTKGTHHHDHPSVRTISLSANNSLVTALANDFGYEHVFSRQVRYFMDPGDVLVAISSSGNSENILRALGEAKECGATTIGLSGFSGGKLREQADISLHVPVENYGVVEDAHQMLMHIIAQTIAGHRDVRK